MSVVGGKMESRKEGIRWTPHSSRTWGGGGGVGRGDRWFREGDPGPDWGKETGSGLSLLGIEEW